jgi:hypothetical protein
MNTYLLILKVIKWFKNLIFWLFFSFLTTTKQTNKNLLKL